jgi:hypothetical protein
LNGEIVEVHNLLLRMASEDLAAVARSSGITSDIMRTTKIGGKRVLNDLKRSSEHGMRLKKTLTFLN